eukprot:TRINITY_DN59171_c0_g1_i1.p1 TRINITY_DN59171_c0_g1~~TRINITY_DN59171_c0_g1_i1.p1  ORF type:complete len:453 (-),score=65.05 TRINITY_DN59171_c0_g1_i1:48-1406(-)
MGNVNRGCAGYSPIGDASVENYLESEKLKESAADGNEMDACPEGIDKEKWMAHVASWQVMNQVLKKTKGSCYIETDSVYGAAVAIPQLARTSGWEVHYTALAFRSYIFLLCNVLLQGFFLYMISKEERINDRFGGQMHLCNLGSGMGSCPEGRNCQGPSGTSYTPERLYNFHTWVTRTYMRDALAAMFPERIAELNAKVDPGEYGVESYWLRMACHFVFVMGIWSDLSGSFVLLDLLYHVPTKDETWLTLRDGTEHFRVAGMPFGWKVTNFVMVLVPKLYLWIILVDVGTLFLMETAGIEDMIMNAIALAFVLEMDELVFETLFSQFAKDLLEQFEPLPLYEAEEEEELSFNQQFEHHQSNRSWSISNPKFWRLLVPTQLVGIVLVSCIFQLKYYHEHCTSRADGSWVPNPLYLPKNDDMSFWSYLFGPFPFLFRVETEDEAIWRMPEPTHE